MSPGSGTARRPIWRMCSASTCAACSLCPYPSERSAPASARRRAVAYPIPLLAPVTRAIRPRRSMKSSFLFSTCRYSYYRREHLRLSKLRNGGRAEPMKPTPHIDARQPPPPALTQYVSILPPLLLFFFLLSIH